MLDAFQVYDRMASTKQHQKSIDLWTALGAYHLQHGHDIDKERLASRFQLTISQLDDIIAGDNRYPIEFYDEIINYVEDYY